jgi:protein-arginine kinase activator protein McsA
LEQIVAESFSYAEVLSKLGYSTAHGHNHKTLKKRLEYYEISTGHFTHKPRTEWTEDEIFCEDSKVSQNKLRKTFKNKNIVPYKCAICGLEPLWNGKPLVLTLDHKNGKNKDNRLTNLQWVCPNCDRQSETYGSKNKKVLQKNVVLYPMNAIKVASSNNTINTDESKMDHKHSNNVEYVDFSCATTKLISKEDLLTLLQLHKGNFTHIGKLFGVSDNTIRKWCKQYELPYHSSDYKERKEVKTEKSKSDYYKPCYMIDKHTKVILMEFPSYCAAEKYLNIPHAANHIGKVCKGERVSAYGYRWIDKEKIAI